jgi:Fe-S cluster assembly ATPase SufC
MRPEPDPLYDSRIKFDILAIKDGDDIHVCRSIDDAMGIVLAQPTGRVHVRGGNGAGKSTLLAALRSDLKNRAYYLPTSDRLAFRFAQNAPPPVDLDENDEVDDGPPPPPAAKLGFSSGERQLRSLQELVDHTDARIYLLDEWDANLDVPNRATADALVERLAARARVVEISHRDRT